MNLDKEVKRQMAILTSGAAEVIPEKELEEKVKKSLETGSPLRVKVGIDPTAPHVHLGHMVVYRKMRQFQDLGHKAILIIGDYTARIGDPTGRNSERPSLTEEQVRENSKTYTDQIFKIVDRENTEVHFQSSWFDKVSLQDILTSASAFSLAHMMSHETFRKRLDEGNRLSLHELFYPVLQAWDSLFIEADVELGGFDQKFNILCGRDLQRDREREPQAAIFMPLLAGTDGRKMSKTFGNHIPVESEAGEKFGKIMSISDDLILPYFTYVTARSAEELNQIGMRLAHENPRDIKMELAEEVVAIYHEKEKAERCRNDFIRQFSRREIPDDIPAFTIREEKMILANLMKEAGITASVSEGRRLISQGAVKIDGQKICDPQGHLQIPEGGSVVLKAGKRRYLKVVRE